MVCIYINRVYDTEDMVYWCCYLVRGIWEFPRIRCPKIDPNSSALTVRKSAFLRAHRHRQKLGSHVM